MSVATMRRLLMTRRLARAWNARGDAENWATWAEKNPDDNKLLSWAERLTNGE